MSCGGAIRVERFNRMNRILEVNEELAYAVVEPGVSFFDLCTELRRRGSSLWVSIPDLGWGSVIGNALDHGWGYLPGGDHAANLCGMEVVLASGEILRTGMGALSAGPAWHAHQRGFGPSVDSLFMQSNFGIVTKAGKWLMPRPEVYLPVTVATRNESDLEAVVDTMRPLLLGGTVRNVPLMGTVTGAASMIRPRAEWHAGDGPLPDSFFRQVMDETGMGFWNLRLALYGTEPVVDAQLATIKAAFSRIPDAMITARKIPGEEVSEETVVEHPERVQGGVPGLALLDSLQWWGGIGGHLDFSPVVPLQGSHVRRLMGILRPETERAGLDFWPGSVLTPRSCVCVSPILYDTTNEQQVRAAFDLYGRLVKLTGEAGYGLYRGHIAFMDDIAAQYGFNDHAMLRLYQTLKQALDPGGILSPGKQGIWPRSMRPDGTARAE